MTNNKNLHNKKVAFIMNSAYIVPATIIRAYPDDRVNLEIQEIQREHVTRVEGTGLSASIVEDYSFVLKPKSRLNVLEGDPCNIYSRIPIALERSQGGNGMMQTHTDIWTPLDKQRRLPRLSGVDTNLIGKWFDPSKWNYKIYAFMDSFYNKILKRQFDAIELSFPVDGRPFYKTFEEVFKDWFQEALENKYMRQNGIPSPVSTDIGSWSRCEIQAVEKEDLGKPILDSAFANKSNHFTNQPGFYDGSISTQPSYEELLAAYNKAKNENPDPTLLNRQKSQSDSSGAKNSKSRKIGSRRGLSKNRK